MSTEPDPDALRAEMLDRWETAATGWGKRADRVREYGMPVSMWMIEHLALQPAQRVLELAAGPGDTGFLAAELVKPGGTLICSDGSEAMLAVARERAAGQGIDNVEFKRLELEWIDLPTADVDVILCRWGLMLCLDPAAALAECRRVLRPGGRLAVAVWDAAAENPMLTVPGAAAVDLGLIEPPEPGAPGPFALSAPGALAELLQNAGFVDVKVEPVAVERTYANARQLIGETLDLSMAFGELWRGLDGPRRDALATEIGRRVEPFAAADGQLRLPGRSLVAAADA
jgi:SAM-dependent methyltransferase